MKRLRRADSMDELSQRPPMETSVFQKSIKLEYPILELAWKRCIEFEAGSAALATVHINSLALGDAGSSLTIHDIEDLHNEVKLCIMQLDEERKTKKGQARAELI